MSPNLTPWINMPTVEKEQAARDAASILKTVWAQSVTPVPLPVDPIRIAASMGIEVFDEVLDANVSGVIVKRPGQDPVILLNMTDSPNRQRFTCAHEIGHFVAHSNDLATDHYAYIDERGKLASAGTDPDEVYANEFAACLLMPEDVVRQLHKEKRTPAEIAAIFRVSDDAMTFRFKNLGLSVP